MYGRARPWLQAVRGCATLVSKGIQRMAICGPLVVLIPCTGRSWPGQSRWAHPGLLKSLPRKRAWLCQLVATAERPQRAMQRLQRIRAELGCFCRPGTESFARTRQGSRVGARRQRQRNSKSANNKKFGSAALFFFPGQAIIQVLKSKYVRSDPLSVAPTTIFVCITTSEPTIT